MLHLLISPYSRSLLTALIAAVLLAASTFLLPLRARTFIDGLMGKLAAFLWRCHLFVSDLDAERRKIDFLRVLTGLVLLLRTLYSAIPILTDASPWLEQAICVCEIFLAASFMVGFLTPICALLLLFFNVSVVDTVLHTYTLGSDVLAMTMIVFAFAPAGTAISVDAVIVSRNHRGAGFIRSLYSAIGLPTLLRLTISKWMMLLCYTLLCLYSVTLHLHETLWLNGDAAVYLFSSTYMSHYGRLFESIFANSRIAIELAKLSMRGMVAWYFLFLPCLLIGGWIRRLAVFWTIMFFLISLFILQLSWLAYYEFILLAILLWNHRFIDSASEGIDILFDDHCNLCDRTIRTLKALDVFKILRFKPLSENAELMGTIGVSREEALTDLYGIDARSRRVYHGYDFYLQISKRLLLLIWLVPFAWIGRVTGIGPAIYRFIADRRVRWFGVCTLQQDHNHTARGMSPFQQPVTSYDRESPLFAAFFMLHTVFASVFLAGLPHSPFKYPNLVGGIAHIYGIAPIDVFNHNDLGLSAHWFTVEAISNNGERILVPVTATDGSRLAWQKYDPVYFGNTLAWRRSKLVEHPVCYVPTDGSYIKSQIDWFARFMAGSYVGYRVDYYYKPLPTLGLEKPFLHSVPSQQYCTATFDRNGNFLSVIYHVPIAKIFKTH